MIDRQSLLAQLLMGPPQPATRLSQLAAGAPADPVDAMRASLPPMATPDTRAGRPNRLAELTMPSAEFEPAVRPFGSPHVPAVTTPSEERRLVDLAMMLSSFVGNIRTPGGLPMGNAARMARAQEMGFRPETFYHGTNRVFDAFDPTSVNSANSPGGHWVALDPRIASGYASGARAGGKGNVLPLKIRASRIAPGEEYEALINEAAKRRVDVRDVMRERGIDAIAMEGTPAQPQILIVRDPDMLRVAHATFDPAQKGSADLLASLFAAGLLGGSAATADAAP